MDKTKDIILGVINIQKIQDYTIIGNNIAPGLGDWYLARKGYEAQQYDGMVDPNRPHNLFEPVPGNFGAHGEFDHLASKNSFQIWISRYRKWFYPLFTVLFLIYLGWIIFA